MKFKRKDIMKTYYVYILASQRNGVLYIGVTSNLIRRICEHDLPGFLVPKSVREIRPSC
jgi:predicted GIY-YIG superfamily endonuclease